MKKFFKPSENDDFSHVPDISAAWAVDEKYDKHANPISASSDVDDKIYRFDKAQPVSALPPVPAFALPCAPGPACCSCGLACGKVLRCGTCRTATYCCQACQKDDWSSHRRNCRKPQSWFPTCRCPCEDDGKQCDRCNEVEDKYSGKVKTLSGFNAACSDRPGLEKLKLGNSLKFLWN